MAVFMFKIEVLNGLYTIYKYTKVVEVKNTLEEAEAWIINNIHSTMKYISKKGNKYYIIRNNEYYDCFDTLEECKSIRDLLESKSWDISEVYI